jgi:hypothetical protein
MVRNSSTALQNRSISSNCLTRFPPGVKKPPLGSPDELPALIIEYVHKFENVKKHYLGERQYWYLNIIGRDPNRSELGQ